ncbi:MAG: hypothetical protein IKQ79_05330 [Bacteroidales bacterium]|nr:hypothetical protein [Bacteroidales bacterium]MBR6929124.1 hypothetical protein [Bacteroidales bacterium]
MDLTWYYIIISLSVVGLIAMLLIEFPICQRVKAGTADKYVFGGTVARRMPKISVDEHYYGTTCYKQMVVAGDSMQDYNIHNGDNIFVDPYDDQGKLNIKRYPVIAITLREPHLPFDSGLKLRKFVGYVGNDDWGAAYDRYISRVKKTVTREKFIASCKKSYNKHPFPLENSNSGIISETYDVESCSYHYSVHSVGLVYGKVMFVGGRS